MGRGSLSLYRRQFLPHYLLNAGLSLTSIIAVGPPAFEHRTLPDDNPILLPLDHTQGAGRKDNHTGAARSIDYNTTPKPAAYGAQLVKRIDQEKLEVSRLIAEEWKKPSSEGQLEKQRRLVRLKSLHDAVWALHMIDISQDPKVWKLLDQNAVGLNLPGTDTTRTLQKAKEAITAGDTRRLEAYIKEVIEKHAQLGHPTRPVSELEKFMERAPAGSAVLSRLRMLQRVATEDTEESRFLVQDTMYGLWWVLERKAEELDGLVGE